MAIHLGQVTHLSAIPLPAACSPSVSSTKGLSHQVIVTGTVNGKTGKRAMTSRTKAFGQQIHVKSTKLLS